MKTILNGLFALFIPSVLMAQSGHKLPAILPHHVNLQFAGAIGFVSAGVGYETRNHRLQGDFMYGYVPESVGGVTIHSVTAKMTWAALTKKMGNELRTDFLTVSVLANYAFGKQYFLFHPEAYPYSYYGFPTAAHVALGIGGAVYYRRLGLYYEVGTTDRYVMSYITNPGSLHFTDLLNVGFGMKYSIFRHRWQQVPSAK